MPRKMPPIYLGTSLGLFYARATNGRYRAVRLANVVPEGTPPADDALGWRSRHAIRGGIVVDKDDPQKIYVGTMHDGVFCSHDAGQSWEPVNQGMRHKNIWSLCQHPRSGHLYAGTEPSALFTSADGGGQWTEFAAIQSLPRLPEWTFPRSPHHSHIKYIAFGPENSPSIFCAVEEGWLLRRLDQGPSWENITDGVEFDSHAVAVFAHDPRLVIATSGDGFFRSTDGGTSFTRCTKGLEHSYLSAPVISPADQGKVYMAASAYPPPRWFGPHGNAKTALYRSDDQGVTWRNFLKGDTFKGGCFAVAGILENPDFFVAGLSDGTLVMTNDGGQSTQVILDDVGVINCLTVVDDSSIA